jgi:hypothetical protein
MVAIANMQTDTSEIEERINQAIIGLENAHSVMPDRVIDNLRKEFPDMGQILLEAVLRAIPKTISENRQMFADRTIQLHTEQLQSGKLPT